MLHINYNKYKKSLLLILNIDIFNSLKQKILFYCVKHTT